MSGKDSEEQGCRRAAECTIEQIGRNSALGLFTRESRFIHVGAESRVPANEALLSHHLQLLQHRRVHRRSVSREVLLDLPDCAGSVIPKHVQDIELCICRQARARGCLSNPHRFTVARLVACLRQVSYDDYACQSFSWLLPTWESEYRSIGINRVGAGDPRFRQLETHRPNGREWPTRAAAQPAVPRSTPAVPREAPRPGRRWRGPRASR